MHSQLRPDSDPALFVHPGDLIDASDGATKSLFDAQLVAASDKHQVAEIFAQMFRKCIPAGSTYKGGRRWKAGYNRMVAIAYVVAPELFFGMTHGQVAAELEITERQFCALRTEIKSTLAIRAETADERAHSKQPKRNALAARPIVGTAENSRVLPGAPRR